VEISTAEPWARIVDILLIWIPSALVNIKLKMVFKVIQNLNSKFALA
jgi:hypothetical protein